MGKIQRENTGNLKDRIVRGLKKAFTNPWNWLLGIHYFAALSIKNALNGLWLISYMRLKFGYSRSLSSGINGTLLLADAVANIIFGKLSAKFKRRKVFFLIGGALMLGPIYIRFCGPDAHIAMIILANIMGGAGTGLAALPFAMIREYNDHFECSDIAGGLFNTLCASSGFVMQWLIGILIDYHWEKRGGQLSEDGDRDYNVADYDCGLIVIPFCSGLYILIALIVKETNAKTVVWDESKPFFQRFFG